MGFNYRQKRKEFEQNWAKALKQYIAAGMTQEQITAMREFDEELFRQKRVYENRINVGLPDLNILRFSVEEDYFQDLSHHLDAAMENAPLPELMDRKKRDIMERKGDKEDENKRQKQQKESSAAAL